MYLIEIITDTEMSIYVNRNNVSHVTAMGGDQDDNCTWLVTMAGDPEGFRVTSGTKENHIGMMKIIYGHKWGE